MDQVTIRAVALAVIGLITALLVATEVAANLRQERQRDAEAQAQRTEYQQEQGTRES